MEAIIGGLTLSWFMACLLSWIIQTISLTEIVSPFPTSTFILLLFLIFTLADTNILNLDKFTCLIFGVTPFLAAFFFLIGTHLTEETEMQIKLT